VTRRSSLRASDADRERTVDRLRTAAGEGRIAAHELEHRVGTALAARTYGELDATIADLPGTARPRRSLAAGVRRHPALAVAAIPVVLLVVALVAAITIATIAVGAALFLAGRRRSVYLGPGPHIMRRLAPAAVRERGTPGYRA
jgi:hypothetical protein